MWTETCVKVRGLGESLKPADIDAVLSMQMAETFYVHLEFKAKTGGWSINLPFLCSKCGVCCTLDDFLTAGELKTQPKNPQAHAKAKALYQELGKRWETDKTEYDHYITHTPCPFLCGTICSIYENRPQGCRQYPNTPFGMQTPDCEALSRFKKQYAALKRGRTAEKTYHFTVQPAKHVQFTEKQHQNCVAKLQKAGITNDELALFRVINKKDQGQKRG